MLRREGVITDQKSLSISSLQTDYLNIDSSSGSGINNERAYLVQKKYTFCGGANHSTEKCFKTIRKDNGKYRVAGDSDKQQTKRTTHKCFRCVSEDHIIYKCPNPPKDN